MRLPIFISCLVGVASFSCTATAQSPVSTVAIADAYVLETDPSSNFGTQTDLQMRRTPPSSAANRISYVKFDISGLPTSLAWVNMKVYVKLSAWDSNSHSLHFSRVVDTSWSEGTITWNNKPTLGVDVYSSGIHNVLTSYAYIPLDITDYVRTLRSQGVSTVSFALRGDYTNEYYTAHSRESGGLPPVIEYLPTDAPTVSISSPMDNQSFYPANAIELRSNATDPDGSVARVDYYSGTTLIGQSTDWQQNFVFVWDSAPTGVHVLTAKAVDNWGASTTSAAITVTINARPTVVMSSPTDGGPFNAPVLVNLVATPSDTDGMINRVEFFRVKLSTQIPELIATVTNPPFTYQHTLTVPDTYMFFAKAVDDLNGEGYGLAPTNVTVTGQGPAASSLNFIDVDHLDTPRVVLNDQGQQRWRWEHTEPFGADLPNENPAGLGAFEFPLRFPGQYFDKETGLSYNYFRDYDPATGRYVQSDPIGLQGGLNTYAYVDGSPLSILDLFGLQGITSNDLGAFGERASTVQWLRGIPNQLAAGAEVLGNKVQVEVNGRIGYPDNFLVNREHKFISTLESKMGEGAKWTEFQKQYGSQLEKGHCRVLNVPGIDPTRTLAQQGYAVERKYIFSHNAYRIFRSAQYQRLMSTPGGAASVEFLFWMRSNGRQ